MATATDDRVFTKRPGESYTIAIEYANRLPSGASLASGTVTATDLKLNVADSSVIASATATISGTQAKVKVQDGALGKDYAIVFKTTLNTGEDLEDVLLMKVRPTLTTV